MKPLMEAGDISPIYAGAPCIANPTAKPYTTEPSRNKNMERVEGIALLQDKKIIRDPTPYL
tara:strand:- start:13 stop:195 length:183 start_codon:yes stop_codon:yes gene_type:complete